MEITGVKIQKVFNDPDKMLVGIASVVVDSALAIHDVRILRNAEKTFIAMPNKKVDEHTYKDVIHPINNETRKAFEEAVISAYSLYLENQKEAEKENN